MERQSRSKVKNKGQTLIEIVIIVPISILLILFTIQTSLLYNSYIILNYAAYCGARAGAVHLSVDSHNFSKASNVAKKAVRTVLIPHSPAGALLSQIDISRDLKTFKVRVVYPIKLFINLFGILPYIQISATSRMVIEGE